MRAGLLLDGPIINRLLGRPLALGVRDRDLNFGDPVATAAVGWHSGNWHWKVAAAASIPAGGYEPGELSNVAFNRWIGDFSAGLTYLYPALGIDLSAVGGFEVNGENPSTDYRSGNAFHLDLSATKFLPRISGRRDRLALPAGHRGQRRGRRSGPSRVGPRSVARWAITFTSASSPSRRV